MSRDIYWQFRYLRYLECRRGWEEKGLMKWHVSYEKMWNIWMSYWHPSTSLSHPLQTLEISKISLMSIDIHWQFRYLRYPNTSKDITLLTLQTLKISKISRMSVDIYRYYRYFRYLECLRGSEERGPGPRHISNDNTHILDIMGVWGGQREGVQDHIIYKMTIHISQISWVSEGVRGKGSKTTSYIKWQ